MQQTWKPWWHFGKIRTLSHVANSDKQMTHSVSKLGNSLRLAGQILNGGMWMHRLSYLDKRNQKGTNILVATILCLGMHKNKERNLNKDRDPRSTYKMIRCKEQLASYIMLCTLE